MGSAGDVESQGNSRQPPAALQPETAHANLAPDVDTSDVPLIGTDGEEYCISRNFRTQLF